MARNRTTLSTASAATAAAAPTRTTTTTALARAPLPPLPSDVLKECIDVARKTVLSVGSGDGSQQKSIVESGHVRLQTTFWDSREEVLRKYPHAGPILAYLEQHSYRPPLFGVDATRLESYGDLGCFDVIFFTFPHTGVPNRHAAENVASNRELIRRFLRSAARCLKPGGQIQLTVKEGAPPYDRWKIDQLLTEDLNLVARASHPLDKGLFPGYVHRLTKGRVGNLTHVQDRQARVLLYEQRRQPTTNVVPPESSFTVSMILLEEEESSTPAPDDVTSVEGRLRQILESNHDKPQTVLELRRQLGNDIAKTDLPDTRQLNRILYQLAEKKQILMLPPDPNGPNKKPRWKMATP